MDLLIDLGIWSKLSDVNYKQDLALKYGTPSDKCATSPAPNHHT